MKFSCEKNILQAACATVSRAVASKSPITALEGILIEAAGENVKVTGYDLKRGIYTSIEADIPDAGSVVVNARFFNEMIHRMPDGVVTIEANANLVMTAKCGKVKYEFMGIDKSEYPELPDFEGINFLEIPEAILKSMINQTLYAVSKDEVRPIYTGSLFEINGNELTLVSVDGYRLAKRVETVENTKLEDCKFIVPGFALSDVEKVCSDNEENVKLEIGEKHISFKIGETVIITRRLEGEFLNHRSSIPSEFKYVIKANRSEFMSVIDRVALILTNGEGRSPIKLNFRNGSINCTCNTTLGKAEDLCICEGSGDELEIGFNDRYLMDALKAADKDEILICLNSSIQPCIIKAADGTENFTYMILPVRLHA